MSKIVLCVDDSATMQQVADITFRGTEFTYIGARTYEEAIEKAKGQQPTVVLVASNLGAHGGSKSGYDVCQALKSDAATQSIPVVILVGNAAPYDNAKGVAAGADANLPKPWDTQTMLEKVAEVVTKAASGVAKVGQGASAGAAAPMGQPAPTAAPTAVPTAAPIAATPAAAAKSGGMATSQPPRSATIMGMPTVKLPGGVATPVSATGPAPAPVTAIPTRTPAIVAQPAGGAMAGLRPPAAADKAPASVSASPSASPSPSPSPSASTSTSVPSSASAAPALAVSGTNRAPMISGIPTKRSALVERTLQKMATRLAEASGLEAGSPELVALLKLSTEVVERIVWEIVPELAEHIIRENLSTLTAAKRPS